MIIKKLQNIQIFLVAILPGLLVNILFLKIGHDAKTSYSCRDPFTFDEVLGWYLSNLNFNKIYISTYINYIFLFFSQACIYLIYNKKLKVVPLIFIGLINCTYPLLNIHTNILKQGFAISFTTLTIYTFLNTQNKYLKIINTVLLSLLAFLSHASSLIVILIFGISLLASYSINLKPLFIFKTDQLFLYNFKKLSLIPLLLLISLLLIINYKGYYIPDGSASFVLILLGLFLFYFYLFKEFQLKDSRKVILYNFTLVFMLVLYGTLFFGVGQTVIERLSLYIIPNILLQIISFSRISLSKNNLIYYLIILLTFFLLTYIGGFYGFEGFYKCQIK